MKLFFIGLVIGIAKIIPGVSGAVLAISFGIYEKLMNSISNFFKDIKSNFIFLFKFGIGILLSIFLFSNIINFGLKKYYIYTMSLFIGLMLGTFPSVKEYKKYFFSRNSYICFFISFFFIFTMPFYLKFDIRISCNNIFYLLLMGFIDAFSTVVPGVSGTALLMIFNAYELIINSFSNIFCLNSLKVLIPFSIGFIVGIVFLTKLVSFLFKKYLSLTNCCVLGFSIASVLMLLIGLLKIVSFNILVILVFLIGYKIGKIFVHYD